MQPRRRHERMVPQGSPLVDEGWYDASLGYAAFVEYIRSVAPPGGFRIMPDVETIRHISQTLYARPFRDWRYDAAFIEIVVLAHKIEERL